jgi:2-keto-4-pentenoate hydratase/2-oxohepta-3-ene-1,7-dioic acid hydratase in catechol pathway
MRIVNHAGRATVVGRDGRGIDVERASGHLLPADPAAVLERWPELVAWAAGALPAAGDVELDERLLGPPSPRPRQILAVGLNDAAHAAEAGLEPPVHPMIFTKLHAALAGPFDAIELGGETVDWEVELVAVIGRMARHVPVERAWAHVAGLTVGQDLSERTVQLRPADVPQYSLGKSLPGFGPIGPALVTADEFDDPDDLELVCRVNGEEVQRGRTGGFIFSLPQTIAYLSSITVLHPGDLVFGGTPPGIGATRTPPRFLAAGDVLESEVAGIGTMRHEMQAGAGAGRASAAEPAGAGATER